MKLLLIAALVLAVSANRELDQNLWSSFKVTHGKSYKNQVEETQRFAIFQDNLKKISEHNALYAAGEISYQLGITQFADMSEEEFKAFLTLKPKPQKSENRTLFKLADGVTAPTSIDWRQKGAVTPIKNQGQCGSCWAFSTVGATESAYFIKTGKLVRLSEQELVDCSTGTPYYMGGCNGGELDPAFQFMKDHGIESEADYPYTAVDGKCKMVASKAVTKVSSYVDVPAHDETSLASAVGTAGPVAVAIDATYLQLYSSGIYVDSRCSERSLNHGVLVVGYTSDYWIVKNSWGTSFGESGYVRMKRGTNQCGIAAEPSYPRI